MKAPGWSGINDAANSGSSTSVHFKKLFKELGGKSVSDVSTYENVIRAQTAYFLPLAISTLQAEEEPGGGVHLGGVQEA